MRELLSFAFQVSLVAFLGFYLIDNLRTGFVSNFFNVYIFLWTSIVFGVLTTAWPMIVPEAKSEEKLTWKDFTRITLFALGTAALVWYKTSSIGWLAMVIAALSGLIVLGLGLLVYLNKDK